MLLWIVKAVQTKKYAFYLFMVWNMFLAAIPTVIVLLLANADDPHTFVIFLSGIIWLLFLPNAYYLLTDFMHLNPDVLVNQRDDKHIASTAYKRGEAAYIYDSFLLFATTFFGVICGGIALVTFYELIADRWSSIAIVLIAVAIVATAVGVYIGRFGRWNSWDAFLKPWAVIADFLKTVTGEKTDSYRVIVVVLTMVLLQLFSIVLVTRL